MRQLEIENQLRDVVSRIIVQVELATSQGRTDINLALEDAFIPILRSVYNLPHLGSVDKPDPEANAAEQNEAQEAGHGLVVACGDPPVFLEMANEVLDA